MGFLRLLKGLKQNDSSQFIVDTKGLLDSGLNRFICYMQKSEIRRHILRPSLDTTGHVIIVGGLGLVDGFSKVQTPKSGQLPVTVFELRNAQYYIKTKMDSFDKNRHGQFLDESLWGQFMRLPDTRVFDGIDHDW